MLNPKMIREGGNVVRFHTANMVKSQDVAQHSYNCALLIDMIASNEVFTDSIDDSERYELVMYMLLHDVPEQHIGDIPGPSKQGDYGSAIDKEESEWVDEHLEYRYKSIFRQTYMSSVQTILCKFVDNLECLYKCQEECSLGNVKFCQKVDRIRYNMRYAIDRHLNLSLISEDQFLYLLTLIEQDGV